MNEIRNFLYQYRSNDTVVIAKKDIPPSMAGQLEVMKKMASIAEHTGYFCGMEHNGNIYVGTVFKAIPEKNLIAALERN